MQQVVDHAGGFSSVEEFLAACDGVPGKAELLDGVVSWVFRPADGSETVINELPIHVVVKYNVTFALREAIRAAGLPLIALGDGLSLQTGAARTRAPDGAIIRAEDFRADARLLERPVVVFEVLSPSTRKVDTGPKVGEYLAQPTVIHYFAVDPHTRTVTLYRMIGDEVHGRAVHEGMIELDCLPGGSIMFQSAVLWAI